jgi:hypothetical protein
VQKADWACLFAKCRRGDVPRVTTQPKQPFARWQRRYPWPGRRFVIGWQPVGSLVALSLFGFLVSRATQLTGSNVLAWSKDFLNAAYECRNHITLSQLAHFLSRTTFTLLQSTHVQHQATATRLSPWFEILSIGKSVPMATLRVHRSATLLRQDFTNEHLL